MTTGSQCVMWTGNSRYIHRDCSQKCYETTVPSTIMFIEIELRIFETDIVSDRELRMG